MKNNYSKNKNKKVNEDNKFFFFSVRHYNLVNNHVSAPPDHLVIAYSLATKVIYVQSPVTTLLCLVITLFFSISHPSNSLLLLILNFILFLIVIFIKKEVGYSPSLHHKSN